MLREGGSVVITPFWALFFLGDSVSLARATPLFLVVTVFLFVLFNTLGINTKRDG